MNPSLGNQPIIYQKENGTDLFSTSKHSGFGSFSIDPISEQIETWNVDPVRPNKKRGVFKDRIQNMARDEISAMTLSGSVSPILHDMKDDMICQFYFASLSVVGLYIMYRIIQANTGGLGR